MKKTVNLLAPGRLGYCGRIEILILPVTFYGNLATPCDCVLFYIWFTPTKRIWIILNPRVGKKPRNSPRGPYFV